MLIKVDDTVEIVAGDDRGVRGRVLSVNHSTGKIVVEGVNLVYKHVQRSQRNPQGGRLSREMPIDASNVMIVDPKSGQRTRIGVRYLDDGSKERYAKQTGTSLGTISPPKAAYARK